MYPDIPFRVDASERKPVTFESSRWLNGPAYILTISSGPRFFDARRLLFQLLSPSNRAASSSTGVKKTLKVKNYGVSFFSLLSFPIRSSYPFIRRILFAIRMDMARLLPPRTIGEIQKRLIPDHFEAKVAAGKTRTVYSPLFVHLA